jgi:hypothetical protein
MKISMRSIKDIDIRKEMMLTSTPPTIRVNSAVLNILLLADRDSTAGMHKNETHDTTNRIIDPIVE